ncbi:MAG: hypothetical protein EZS28_014437, partial [Streblomastix strix]
PFNPVGDPTTKHIRLPPTPTSGLQPSRFSEPCFALSMLRRGNALDRQIVTIDRIVVIGSSDTDISLLERLAFAKSRFLLLLTLVSPQYQRDADLEEKFEESQYESIADSDGRKPKYQLIQEKDDEIMGRGQGGEKYDWGIDCEGYDVCAENETLLKINVEISISPIIARTSCIPGTQEIVQIALLLSAKADPQREKDIQIELFDNEKKTSCTSTICSEFMQLFAATLFNLGLQKYIYEVPGVVLNINLKKREQTLTEESIDPYDMHIISAGIQDQNLKRLPQTIAENDIHVAVADGAITMNDEADAIRLQRFIHKPKQPGGKK